MSANYLAWLNRNYTSLWNGARLRVPSHLGHPKWSGFSFTAFAEPAGQVADWVASLRNGSRVHIHEFANGALVAHVDRIDPQRGPLEALAHWVTESWSGRLAVAGVVAVLAARVLK